MSVCLARSLRHTPRLGSPSDLNGSHVHQPCQDPTPARLGGASGTQHSPGFLLQILQVGLQSVVGGRAGFQVSLDLCQLLFGKTKEFIELVELFKIATSGSWCP